MFALIIHSQKFLKLKKQIFTNSVILILQDTLHLDACVSSVLKTGMTCMFYILQLQ